MDALAENTDFNHIPAGTAMAFFQAAAPTGWTKSTDNNDAVLRVVSGSGGGTGGSESIATPSHTHSAPNHQHQLAYSVINTYASGTTPHIVSTDADGAVMFGRATTGSDTRRRLLNQTEDSGGGGASGAPSAAFKYIDVIIATKDA